MKRTATRIAAGIGVAMVFSAMAAAGQPCPGTTVVSNEESLSPAWRASLEDLVKATSGQGHLWSCSGARLFLIEDATTNGAVLRIEDRNGRSAQRYVGSPADLVPMGEALLASGEVPAPDEWSQEIPAQNTPSPFTRPTVTKKIPARHALGSTPLVAPSEPRSLIGVIATTRYVGPFNAVGAGFAIRGSVPFGNWSVALQGRFDFPTWIFDKVPNDFSMSEASIGLGLGRRLFRKPFELQAVLNLSLNVITMEGGDEPNLAQASGTDPRVGLEIRMVWPINQRWRIIAGIDGAIAPMALVGSTDRQIDEMLPPLPSYAVGMSLGVEMGLR